MAHKTPPYTFRNGFRQDLLADSPCPWEVDRSVYSDYNGNLSARSASAPESVPVEPPHYTVPPASEVLTSPKHNDKGLNVQRHWPTLFDGTASPHGVPRWWQEKEGKAEVDVLIVGAGPSGLEAAVSFLRQGISFRIIDKLPTPLIAGRANGVQPRYLETIGLWGLASEVLEEGPLIQQTAIYKDGKLLHFGYSHMSDSRYRGLHVITQAQIERILIRDLLRHQTLVDRETVLKEYHVIPTDPSTQEHDEHPIRCTLQNLATGQEELVRAKFLLGTDGASSGVRKSLGIPFDGMDTGIFWGILDCRFESDYPHAWVFGSVINSKHGGCFIVPRENGYIRIYTKLDISSSGQMARDMHANNPDLQEFQGQVDIHSITPDDVLKQARKNFHPWKLEMVSPLSWFAIWKIGEKVARSFSSDDQRVHIVGDAAHVHSVMGAFGLNLSIIDSANLAWKIGLCAKGHASIASLMPTYDSERRLHANNVLEVSGTYLRFVSAVDLGVVNLKDKGKPLGDEELEEMEEGENRTLLTPDSNNASPDQAEQRGYLLDYFRKHGMFLLCLDAAYGRSVLNPPPKERASSKSFPPSLVPLTVKNGVRAPNPRVCFDANNTGYLYDKLAGQPRFHLVVFGSDLLGPVRRHLAAFARELVNPKGFYRRFGGSERFNLVLVAKGIPFEVNDRMEPSATIENIGPLAGAATVLYDDRPPDEDAHSTYGVNHSTGAIAVVRPDLWMGMGLAISETDEIDKYFTQFLIPVSPLANGIPKANGTPTANGAPTANGTR